MVNTVTQVTLRDNGKDVYKLINIASDGSEETDLNIFDTSTHGGSATGGTLVEVWASGSSCICRLEWDQGTDAPIASFDPAYTQYLDLRSFGGIPNPAGTSATGDIFLTTASLDNLDEITLILHVVK